MADSSDLEESSSTEKTPQPVDSSSPQAEEVVSLKDERDFPSVSDAMRDAMQAMLDAEAARNAEMAQRAIESTSLITPELQQRAIDFMSLSIPPDVMQDIRESLSKALQAYSEPIVPDIAEITKTLPDIDSEQEELIDERKEREHVRSERWGSALRSQRRELYAKDKRMTQEYVSHAMGWSRRRLKAIENPKPRAEKYMDGSERYNKSITVSELFDLAELYQIDPMYLIGERTEEEVHVLHLWKALSADAREKLLALLQSMVSSSGDTPETTM